MPSNPVVLTITGLSSSSGFPMWMPDYGVRPFNIGIGVVVSSTAASLTYNVEHSFDYQGNLSSDFNGFISSAATWFVNTGISSAGGNANGNYAFPVSAIRLNVTTGSSLQTINATFMQG